MLCCSSYCKYYKDCRHSVINNPEVRDNIEPFDSFGSGCYTYNSQTNQIDIQTEVLCNNYSMYRGNINKTEEKKEMNDNLTVQVKITPYNKDPNTSNIDLDFDHPLYIHSIYNYDELVELEHNGHKIIVSQSELEKAIRLCTHNRW